MTTLAGFRDMERVVGDLVDDLGTVGNQTPADLQGQLPFIRLQTVGGDDDRITDRTRLEVTTYAGSLTSAKAIAETIRQRLMDVPYPIDRMDTEVRPHRIPHDDTDVRVVTATYRLSARR